MIASAVVKDYAGGEGLAAGAAAPVHPEDGWTPVPVPGDVHRALVAAGCIEDPFYDRNEDGVRWIEDREWWYRARFEGGAPAAADERVRLVFGGLDTYAAVYLNGEELGRHANMFREAVFDVTGRVRDDNLLAVRFDPPIDHVGPPLEGQWSPTDHDRVWMRKAQYGYGWDWGPRLPTIGIWRPVELRRERVAALEAVRFQTLRIQHGDALVAIDVEVDRFAGTGPLEARIELLRPDGGAPLEAAVEVQTRATAVLRVPDAALWWTHDLGTPALHELRVELVAGNAVVATRELRVGIRTIELDQRPDPDEPGTRFFRFRLNGVGLFARGANWIPADSFVGGLEDERYTRLLGAARDAHMNMIRVWGGGIYEHDRFYDECDALGLLVWQDFMFACAIYPEHELAAEVELEARYQVARLRHHPSLALWCGNNENQWIHDRENPLNGVNRVPGALFYDDVLPRAVAELDPTTPYWPGSPYGGDDHNGRTDGDVHNWEVWHGNFPRRFGEDSRREPTPASVSFRRYAEDDGRFISEFGTLSAPHPETLRRWIPPDQLYHHSPSLDHHTKDAPKNKIDMLLQSVTGVAEDLETFVDFSMIAQAEALKFGVEHYRRRAPHCSGTLIWQLNDCWPGLSWALIDYHGFEKAAYHFVRRAYAPVLASFRLADGAAELWVTNDTGATVHDEARVRLARFAGGPPLEDRSAEVVVPAHASRCVGRWEFAGGPDRYLRVESARGAFGANRSFFAAIKDLERPPARVEHTVEPAGDGRLAVRLQADAYAYFVHVASPDEHVRYSDNHIDLEAGEERTTIVSGARAEDLRVRWR